MILEVPFGTCNRVQSTQEKKRGFLSHGCVSRCGRHGDEVIHDGVELPKLLRMEKVAEVLGVDIEAVRRWIEDRSLSTLHVNGIVHVLTESIADRLGEETPSRSNQEGSGGARSAPGGGAEAPSSEKRTAVRRRAF